MVRKFLVGGLLLAFPLIAAAEQDAQGSEGRVLEEIVVTAQKREQRVFDVPQSLQLINEDFLVENVVRDVSELITFIPGASEGLGVTMGQRRYQIRGIYQESGSATVGYYLDETPTDGDTAAPIGRVYDMQRVEVLRGPQSTLYGNGAMGGVVRYIPNQPDLTEVQAGVRVGYAEAEDADSGHYVDAFASIPLIQDQLGVRLVVSSEEIGGYADQFIGEEDINPAEMLDIRAHVLWEPSENWRLKLLYSNSDADHAGGGLLLSGLFPDDTISTGGLGDYNDNEFEVISGTVEYSGFGFADLVSTTAATELVNDSQLYLALPGLSAVTAVTLNTIEITSNETRLVSKGDGPLNWVAGIYVTDREITRDGAVTWEPEIPPFFVSSTSYTVDDRESQAFFGELSYSLLDGRLTPLIGVRRSEEDFDGDTVTIAGGSGTESFESTSYRFNLSWAPSDEAHYYLNVADGFRSGVFNNEQYCGGTHRLLLIEGSCELIQESDELTSYEVGGKYVTWDGRLNLEGAFFYIDWQRTPQQLPIGGLYQTYNVGDSEIRGIDLAVMLQPESIPGLNLSLTANWINAEFTNVTTLISATLTPPFAPESVGAEEGEFLPFVPKWSATLSANYAWTFGRGWNGSASLTLTHLDGQFGQFGANTERGDPRDLLRARVGVEKNNFGAFLFARNLLDEDGTIFAQAPTGGVPVFTRDYPRQVGIELTYNLN